jgi:hypothetical protein
MPSGFTSSTRNRPGRGSYGLRPSTLRGGVSMDPLDRLADKFTAMNEHVARDLRRAQIREALDQMVLDGKLGYDPETGEYINLMGAASEADE